MNLLFFIHFLSKERERERTYFSTWNVNNWLLRSPRRKERSRMTFLLIIRFAEDMILINYASSIDTILMLMWSLRLTILFATSDLGGCGVRELQRSSDEFMIEHQGLRAQIQRPNPFMSDHVTDVIPADPTTRTEDRIEVSKSLGRNNGAAVRSGRYWR